MKIWIRYAALLLWASSLPLGAAGVKVGFVNIGSVMEKAPQAEAARKALEKEFAARDAKLTADRDAILELENKLTTDSAIMSESERGKLERDIRARKREFSRARDEFKEDFNIRRNDELGKLQREIKTVIEQLAKSEKYDLLVTEQVLYASEKIDITDKILRRLKASYKRGRK